jgi:hypothetical protein
MWQSDQEREGRQVLRRDKYAAEDLGESGIQLCQAPGDHHWKITDPGMHLLGQIRGAAKGGSAIIHIERQLALIGWPGDALAPSPGHFSTAAGMRKACNRRAEGDSYEDYGENVLKHLRIINFRDKKSIHSGTQGGC